ncbi:hypothetical protein ABE073_04475 [Lederbergia citrisecunda]|uniref:hypothetical protein n=1 Tax=Lederbergia citrisecunda TaxID=2833583 RepID=UPI003D2725E8
MKNTVFIVSKKGSHDSRYHEIVWKVYDSEKKAISACKHLNAYEEEIGSGSLFKYVKWNVR